METARLIRKSFFESWRKRACIERVHLCCPANHATFARLEQWLWQRMIACKHVVIFSVKATVSGLSVHLSQCMYNVVEWKPFRAKDQTFDAWLPKLWFAWLCETFAQCRFLVYLLLAMCSDLSRTGSTGSAGFGASILTAWLGRYETAICGKQRCFLLVHMLLTVHRMHVCERDHLCIACVYCLRCVWLAVTSYEEKQSLKSKSVVS